MCMYVYKWAHTFHTWWTNTGWDVCMLASVRLCVNVRIDFVHILYCIHTYKHTHINTKRHRYIHTHTYIHTYIHTWLRHSSMPFQTSEDGRLHSACRSKDIRTYIHTYIHTWLRHSSMLFQISEDGRLHSASKSKEKATKSLSCTKRWWIQA